MNRRTVMVIDGNGESRTMTHGLISELQPDWRILESESPEEALRQVSEDHVDYFSVDLNMPGMNGFELITRLRDHFPGARYALLTADVQKGIKERAEALGISFIHKPVSAETIAMLLLGFNRQT